MKLKGYVDKVVTEINLINQVSVQDKSTLNKYIFISNLSVSPSKQKAA